MDTTDLCQVTWSPKLVCRSLIPPPGAQRAVCGVVEAILVDVVGAGLRVVVADEEDVEIVAGSA